MDINDLELLTLEYDNSIKKIISKINYKKKDFFLKLEDIQIINFKNKIIFIKNNFMIKELLFNTNNLFKNKFKVDNILNLDLETNILSFKCLLENINIQEEKLYSLLLYLSHIEYDKENKNFICDCYVIKIS